MDKYIECWGCKNEVGLRDLSENDGLCPYCDCEINLNEDPYKTSSTKVGFEHD